MSLNISVSTRSAIHQSADFCVTEFVLRGGMWVPRTIAPAPKVTVLQYTGWRAVITYVGIAKLDDISTADWLARELTHPIGQRSVEEVVERIRSKASRSLASSVPAGFPRNHTFTMGVLVDGASPQLILISNFESFTAPLLQIAKDDLFVSNRYLGSREPTLVAVSGIPGAVDTSDRKLLDRIVRSTKKADSIRQKIAEVNRRAAGRPQSRGMISPSCAVFSLFAEGNGSGELHGDPQATELVVSTIMNGLDLGAMVRQIFAQQRPAQRPVLRGMTMVSNQRDSEERRGGEFAPDTSADQHAKNGGTVLIAGGTHQTIHRTAELYDSSKGTFSFTSNMAHPRLYHVAVRLGDGRVLITGGRANNQAGGVTSSAEVFAPATSLFSRIEDMSVRREACGAVLLANGNVLIVGGSNETGPTNTMELYDPSKELFALSANTRGPRHAILLRNGLVLTIGGANPSVELFDLSGGSFVPTTELIHPRSEFTATLLPSGEVLIAGGNPLGSANHDLFAAEVYDPAQRSFRHAGNATMARIGHTETLLSTGKVLLAGGRRYIRAAHGGIIEIVLLAACELYDPSSGSFEPTGDMCDVRYCHTATRLNNGEVLVVGGQTITRTSDTAEIYDPSTGRFRPTGNLNVARRFHTATLL